MAQTVVVGNRVITLGVYRHFKGRHYLVVDAVRDCDTLEYKVLYSSLYDDKKKGIKCGDLFYRGVQEFFSPTDKVKYPNATQDQRFKFIMGIDEFLSITSMNDIAELLTYMR